MAGKIYKFNVVNDEDYLYKGVGVRVHFCVNGLILEYQLKYGSSIHYHEGILEEIIEL